MKRWVWIGVCGTIGSIACTLPQTVEMTKLKDAAPVCATVTSWERYRDALAQGPAGRSEVEVLVRDGQCVDMPAGVVVREISIHETLPEDSVAIRLEKWEQPGTQNLTAGVTWRSNLYSWKWKEPGGFWKFWK